MPTVKPNPLLRMTLTLAAALALGLATPAGRAHGDHDHDRARAAVQAGKVLPLNGILQRVAREHPGQVLEVELEDEDGRWVYEIRLLAPGGRLVKLELDAASGELLSRRERGASPHGRR